jgi:predicted dithiol-disulfide oxidoreductase (DUF899 family)
MSAPNPLRYPASASQEYIAARDELLKAEFDLRNQIEKVAELRRALPPCGIMKEYTFVEVPGNKPYSAKDFKNTTLVDLVTDGRTAVIYHMMFAKKDLEPCNMCATFVDGLNGVAQHIQQRVNFAVIAKAPPEQLQAYAAKRGWTNVRFLSSFGTSFNGDVHMENPEYEEDATQGPGISVYRKDNEGVRHVYTASAGFADRSERGLDMLSPLWNLLDLVPEGRGEKWYPQHDYLKMAAA